jgi:uncharacterized protein (TIRG00374 family)
MKKFLLFLFSLLIGAGILIWIGEVVGWREIGKAFSVFAGWEGIVIFFLTLLMILVGTWKWKEILKGEEIKISFKGLLNPYLAGFSLMFLAPILVWGGEVFRAYILKEKHSTPWLKGMASIIIDRILEWTVNLFIIFFGIIFFLYKINIPPKNLGIIFGGVFLVFFLGISFFYFKTFKKESVAKAFGKIFNNKLDSQPLEIEKEIFNFFKLNKIPMWKAIGISFLRSAVMYLRAWVLILFLGKNIGALSVLSILGFTYLAAMIPIPTSLGSHEAIQTFAFNSLGLGLSTATAFTMIIRGAELLIALAGLVVVFHFGLKMIKKTIFKKIDNFIKNTNGEV